MKHPNKAYRANPAHSFPKHFNGSRFFNPFCSDARKFRDFLRWRLTREPMRHKHISRIETQTFRFKPTQAGKIRVTFIGHSSFFVQAGEQHLLIDPVLSSHAGPLGRFGPRRMQPPGVSWEEMPRIDHVLLTHGHYDHCDYPSLNRLNDTQKPHFFSGLGLQASLGAGLSQANWTHLDWGDCVELGPELSLTFLPAQHWTSRTLLDRNRSLWGGFLIHYGSRRLYFPGDTGFCKPMLDAIAPLCTGSDLAFLPIGAYEPRWFMKPSHINPTEAVAIFKRLSIQKAWVHHFGTFNLSDENVERTLSDLRDALLQGGIDAHQFLIPMPGQSYLV